MRDEMLEIEEKKITKAKTYEKKTKVKKSAATEVKEATTSSKMKAMGVEKVPVIVLSDWEDEEEDITNWEKKDKGEICENEDPIVYRDSIQGQESAELSGEMPWDIGKRVEVVTQSGRRAQSVRYGQ